MSEVVVQVENLYKMYNLGTIGTGSFRRDLQQWWSTNVLKKDDPYFYLSSENNSAGSRESILALQNISFDVKHGEVIGIIGSNGSGKSTLLKIISRIIRPTQGVVRGNAK